MFCPSGDGRVTNTLVATGPDTDTHYDKIHLYDAFGFLESRTVAPGYQPVTINVDDVVVGLTTCYDIRFPELYIDLAQRGAQLITVSASWGSGPGKLEQWTLLTRARALDTAAFVAACDQAYPGDEIAATGPTGVGGSVVAGPYGDVVAAAGPDASCCAAMSTSITWRKPRTHWPCCATAHPSLSSIRQNCASDESAAGGRPG